MHHPRRLSAAMLALALAAPSLALGGEVVLPFRLVTQDVQSVRFDAPAGADHSLAVTSAVGTATFEDGRIAHKTFVYTGDDGPEEGSFTGYSSYVFENGDSLNLRFTGGWSPDGAGGDYEVLSGTGAFAGATGTGRFDATDTDWQGATLWTGSFTLDLPES